jgi:hypothetical protein
VCPFGDIRNSVNGIIHGIPLNVGLLCDAEFSIFLGIFAHHTEVMEDQKHTKFRVDGIPWTL